MYGRIESKWTFENGALQLNVTIPANSEGIAHLPTREIEAITESGHSLAQAEGIREIRQDTNRVVVTVGSGSYDFQVNLNQKQAAVLE